MDLDFGTLNASSATSSLSAALTPLCHRLSSSERLKERNDTVAMIKDALASSSTLSIPNYGLTETAATLLHITMHRYVQQELTKRKANGLMAIKDWRWISQHIGGLYPRIFLGDKILLCLSVIDELPALTPDEENSMVLEILGTISKCFLVHDGYLYRCIKEPTYKRIWELLLKLASSANLSLSSQQDILRLCSQLSRVIPFNQLFMDEVARVSLFMLNLLDSFQSDFPYSSEVFEALLNLGQQALFEERIQGPSFPFSHFWETCLRYAIQVRNLTCFPDIVDCMHWLTPSKCDSTCDGRDQLKIIFEREVAKPKLLVPTAYNCSPNDALKYRSFWKLIEITSLVLYSENTGIVWNSAKTNVHYAALMRLCPLPPNSELMMILASVSDQVLWLWVDAIQELPTEEFLELLSHCRFQLIDFAMQSLVTKNWPSCSKLLLKCIPLVHFSLFDPFLPQYFKAFASVQTDVDALDICPLLQNYLEWMNQLFCNSSGDNVQNSENVIKRWLVKILTVNAENSRLSLHLNPSVFYVIQKICLSDGWIPSEGTVLHELMYMRSFQTMQSCEHLNIVLESFLKYPVAFVNDISSRLKWFIRLYKSLHSELTISPPNTELQRDHEFYQSTSKSKDNFFSSKISLLRLAQNTALDLKDDNSILKNDTFVFVVHEIRNLMNYDNIYMLPSLFDWLADSQINELIPERLHFLLNDRILSALPQSINVAARALTKMITDKRMMLTETLLLMCVYILKKIPKLAPECSNQLVQALMESGLLPDEVNDAVVTHAYRLSLKYLPFNYKNIEDSGYLFACMLDSLRANQFHIVKWPKIRDWTLHTKRQLRQISIHLKLTYEEAQCWLSGHQLIVDSSVDFSSPQKKGKRTSISELFLSPTPLNFPSNQFKEVIFQILSNSQSLIYVPILKVLFGTSRCDVWRPLIAAHSAYYYGENNEFSWMNNWAKGVEFEVKAEYWPLISHSLRFCGRSMTRNQLNRVIGLVSSVSSKHFETKELLQMLLDQTTRAEPIRFGSIESALIIESAIHMLFSKGNLGYLENWIYKNESSDLISGFPDEIINRLLEWRCISGMQVLAARQFDFKSLSSASTSIAEALVEYSFVQPSCGLIDISSTWLQADLHSKFAIEGIAALTGNILDDNDFRIRKLYELDRDSEFKDLVNQANYAAEISRLVQEPLRSSSSYDRTRFIVLDKRFPNLFGSALTAIQKLQVFSNSDPFVQEPCLKTASSAPTEMLEQLASVSSQYAWLKPVLALRQFDKGGQGDDPEAIYQLLLSNAKLISSIDPKYGSSAALWVDTLLKLAFHSSKHRCAPPSVIQKEYLQVAYDISINQLSSQDAQLRWCAQQDLAVFLEERYVHLHESIPSKLEQCQSNQNALISLKNLTRTLETERQRTLLETQVALDADELSHMLNERKLCLVKCIEHYLHVLKGTDRYDLVVFKIVALWFEELQRDETTNVALGELLLTLDRLLPTIPSHKFVALITQLANQLEYLKVVTNQSQKENSDGGLGNSNGISDSHLNIIGGHLKLLSTLTLRVASKHPYHCAWTLVCLSRGDPNLNPTNNGNGTQKRKATSTVVTVKESISGRILETLKASPGNGQLFTSIHMVANVYLDLALLETSPEMASKAQGKEIKFDNSIQNKLAQLPPDCPVPTLVINIEPDGSYKNIVTVRSLGMGYSVIGGINLPKIIYCLGSDGIKYKQLVKGKDDVRHDAMVEQLFSTVNRLLSSQSATQIKDGNSNREETIPKDILSVRTFRVVPLAHNAGILEWVPNSIPLGDYLNSAHERWRPHDWTPRQVRKMMKADFEDPSSVQKGIEHKIKLHLDICEHFRPVLRYFFFEKMPSPSAWMQARIEFARSVATSSMLGYVVGLGDRHCQNILLDCQTGAVIHIDLNMIFEGGRALRVPERVPFRLTRDMQDGLGPSISSFHRYAVQVLKTLRREERILLTVLGSLAATTTTAPMARAKERARSRLRGIGWGSTDSLSIEAQARLLEQEAMSVENLAVMYPGWQPWM